MGAAPQQSRRIAAAVACLASALLAWSASAQATVPGISSAPGGVPVPPVPALAVQPSAPVVGSPGPSVFRVRVLDGRTGVPIERAHLRLWYDESSDAAYALTTNAQGLALMPAPVGLPVRVLVQPVDRIDCRLTQGSSAEAPPGYNVSDLAESGAIAGNHCGRFSEKPRPGELVLFVRPLRWYEGLNRP